MRISIALAMLALAGPAFAADMPLKVPAYPYQASGFYFGIHAGADVAQASASGTNLFATSALAGNLTAAGGEVGLAAGYIHGSIANDNWWGVSSECAYQNVTASVPVAGVGAGAASRWSCMQTLEVSTAFIKKITAALPNLGLQGFTGAFPGFSPIAPPGVNVAAPHEFIGGGFREYGLTGSFGGAEATSWSASFQVRYGALWQALDAANKPNGTAVKVFAWTAFPNKGVEINGLFGPGNPSIGAGVGLKQQYGLAMQVLFGG